MSNKILNDEPVKEWETIGKINIGVDNQCICDDCGESKAGVYFEIRNKETQEDKAICEDCQFQLFRF